MSELGRFLRICFIIAACCTGVAGAMLPFMIRLRRRFMSWRKVDGAIFKVTPLSGSDSPYYMAQVEFIDDRGARHVVNDSLALDSTPEVGTTIPVLFPAAEPEKARLDVRLSKYGRYGVVFVVALVAATLVLLMALANAVGGDLSSQPDNTPSRAHERP